jgi:hypothetical protein
MTAPQLMDCGVGLSSAAKLCSGFLKYGVWAHLMALAPYTKSDVESESGMNYTYCFRHFDISMKVFG